MANNLIRNGGYTIGKVSYLTDCVFKAEAGFSGPLTVIKAPPSWGLPYKTGRGHVVGGLLVVDDAKDAGKAFCKQGVAFEKAHPYEYGKKKFALTDFFLVNEVAENKKLDPTELKPSDFKLVANKADGGITGISIERIAKIIMSAAVNLTNVLFNDSNQKNHQKRKSFGYFQITI